MFELGASKGVASAVQAMAVPAAGMVVEVISVDQGIDLVQLTVLHLLYRTNVCTFSGRTSCSCNTGFGRLRQSKCREANSDWVRGSSKGG